MTSIHFHRLYFAVQCTQCMFRDMESTSHLVHISILGIRVSRFYHLERVHTRDSQLNLARCTIPCIPCDTDRNAPCQALCTDSIHFGKIAGMCRCTSRVDILDIDRDPLPSSQPTYTPPSKQDLRVLLKEFAGF